MFYFTFWNYPVWMFGALFVCDSEMSIDHNFYALVVVEESVTEPAWEVASDKIHSPISLSSFGVKYFGAHCLQNRSPSSSTTSWPSSKRSPQSRQSD